MGLISCNRRATVLALLLILLVFWARRASASPSCEEKLRSLGAKFELGEARPGVTPVILQMPLNGLSFRFLGAPEPRSSLIVHCELALQLWKAAKVLRDHGVVEVTDVETYRYRCKGDGAEPPDCDGRRLSLHAFARAIDIAGVTTSKGLYLSVADDWKIDRNRIGTCSTKARKRRRGDPKDAALHDILCALRAAKLFSFYLTPNYNAAHRGHWHLDLLPSGKTNVTGKL